MEEVIATVSQKIGEIIGHYSFEFWKKDEFRTLIDFGKLSRTEQDRIFNELEVTCLGLLDLHLANSITHIGAKEQKLLYSELKKALPESFPKVFASLGVEDEHIKMWRLLIDIRFDEYRGHYTVALKQAKSWHEFDSNQASREIWARIETCTIDGLSHIRRGKAEEGDPLWKMLGRWLTQLDVLFMKLLQEETPDLQIPRH